MEFCRWAKNGGNRRSVQKEIKTIEIMLMKMRIGAVFIKERLHRFELDFSATLYVVDMTPRLQWRKGYARRLA
jgi:hypothetical protein